MRTEATHLDIQWPHMVQLWTGQSYIHRSRAEGWIIDATKRQHYQIMKWMVHANVPSQVWESLFEYFPECEWMITEQEFNALMLLDVHRHLNDLGNSESVKIKNPVTGNEFHKIALLSDKFVGGIRWWIDAYEDTPGFKLYWRFRWAMIEEDPDNVRSSSRQKLDAVVEEYAVLMSTIDIPEPTDEQVEEARVRVRHET